MSVCSSVCLHACATNCAHSSFFLYCVQLRHAVQVRSFSVQVRLASVPSAWHPRLGPPRINLSARTPLDVGLLGLAPSDRPLSAQSLGSCCTLLHPAAPCCTLLHSAAPFCVCLAILALLLLCHLGHSCTPLALGCSDFYFIFIFSSSGYGRCGPWPLQV